MFSITVINVMITGIYLMLGCTASAGRPSFIVTSYKVYLILAALSDVEAVRMYMIDVSCNRYDLDNYDFDQ